MNEKMRVHPGCGGFSALHPAQALSSTPLSEAHEVQGKCSLNVHVRWVVTSSTCHLPSSERFTCISLLAITPWSLLQLLCGRGDGLDSEQVRRAAGLCTQVGLAYPVPVTCSLWHPQEDK